MDRTMYGKLEPGYSYQPYRVTVQKNGLAPGYALLADLQNTVSPDTSLIGGGGGTGSTPGYGSLNGTRGHGTSVSSAYRPTYENHVPRSTTPLQSQSPTYQNREAIEEARTGGIGAAGASQYNQGGTGGKMPSLNNNLSELDTLLQDLSNARYNSHATDRVPDMRSTNGETTSPMLRSTSSLSTGRPTVDTLLEELSTGMPNGDYPEGQRVKVTVQETTTEVQPGSGEVYYPPSHHGSLNRRDIERSYAITGNGQTASNATKELDDLMASLSEFKINGSNHQRQTVTDSAYAKPNKATVVKQYQSISSSGGGGSPLPPGGVIGGGGIGVAGGGVQEQRVHISETRTSHHYQPQYESHTATAQSVTHIKQNQLDSMLGNLQADMSRQGVNTTQKGCCSACEKPIVGQVITALGKTWHPEHFTCTHCSQELGTRNFFEREGHPYCEPDYHNLFSPRCAYCNGPILDKCVTALEKTWHTEHFFCAQCGNPFGEEGFHERDGKPYCRQDYFDMFAPKCGGCNRAIMENYISALNSQWHPDCFVCRDCRQKFQGGSFFDHEGQPYCETHYHAKRGSLCAGCHKPITGRCITAMFRKFHPEHFVCAFCLKQLNKGTFKEQNDKPYCHGCFEKLFG
ncbi:leupaxin isoform X1 [Nasonia vitripennis]|uniref:LIM zinc-binding domain-containing protein n=1 Tax=Nasonia vitripennis TaxID=7425 RepID=A0A7M7QK26_NASVI|nr:leupaxin isoform X1 [Nasonia vitripennis]